MVRRCNMVKNSDLGSPETAAAVKYRHGGSPGRENPAVLSPDGSSPALATRKRSGLSIVITWLLGVGLGLVGRVPRLRGPGDRPQLRPEALQGRAERRQIDGGVQHRLVEDRSHLGFQLGRHGTEAVSQKPEDML